MCFPRGGVAGTGIELVRKIGGDNIEQVLFFVAANLHDHRFDLTGPRALSCSSRVTAWTCGT
ncbi:MAG: hypothetical protein WCF90_02590 [Methanomicrobiales archaeon]